MRKDLTVLSPPPGLCLPFYKKYWDIEAPFPWQPTREVAENDFLKLHPKPWASARSFVSLECPELPCFQLVSNCHVRAGRTGQPHVKQADRTAAGPPCQELAEGPGEAGPCPLSSLFPGA